MVREFARRFLILNNINMEQIEGKLIQEVLNYGHLSTDIMEDRITCSQLLQTVGFPQSSNLEDHSLFKVSVYAVLTLWGTKKVVDY